MGIDNRIDKDELIDLIKMKESCVEENHDNEKVNHVDQDVPDPEPSSSEDVFSGSALGDIEVESDNRWSIQNMDLDDAHQNKVPTRASSSSEHQEEVDQSREGDV